MLQKIRHTIFLKFIWGLLGLHILNFSINIADNIPANKLEDLSINDQESIIEFILEKVIGDEDAIEEYNDIDSEEHSQKKHTPIQLFLPVYSEENSNNASIATMLRTYFEYKQNLVLGSTSLFTPPPQLV